MDLLKIARKMADKKGEKNSKVDYKTMVFNEFIEDVEKDLKFEKYEKLWKKYKKFINALLSFALLYGISYAAWNKYDTNLREKLTLDLINVNHLIDVKKNDDALFLLESIYKKHPKAQKVLALFYKAGIIVNNEKTVDFSVAQKIYEEIYKEIKKPKAITEYAKILWVGIEINKYEGAEIPDSEAENCLQILNSCSEKAWRFLAEEYVAILLYKQGKFDKAKKTLIDLSKNAEITEIMRMRIKLFLQNIEDKI